MKHGQLLNRRTTSRGSMDNAESPVEMGHYSNGKYEKTRMEDMEENNKEHDQNSDKKEADLKLVTKIDKVTKFVYPTAYVIFNVVYWYQLRDVATTEY